jgi:arabinose-5-phosphate isomerase
MVFQLTGSNRATDYVDELFFEMQAHLGYFFEQLDLAAVKLVVQELLSCKGTVILTGVGKSGIACKKVAMTMNSCGTRALYLSPLDALHGDISVVSEDDVVLLFSKSGESDELLQLCPTLRNKGAKLVAVVSSQNSRLSRACDIVAFLPVSKELCPFDIAPTTSTVVQLLFGDLVSIALMRTKNISIDQFLTNHPAGRIGKRLTFKVKDLMLSGAALPTCGPNDLIVDLLVELSNKKCGCIMVVDEDQTLLGIFTDGDLRRGLQKEGALLLNCKVSELMTKTARVTTPEMLAYDAMKEMESNQKGPITALCVVSQGKLVGLVRLHDILQSGL